jgi:4-amino-4-deoxy-L-arabinose transferase-like glycosyltransferase
MWLSPANFLPMYLAQAAIAATGTIPAYLIARRLFDSRTGLFAALLYAVYPEFAFLPTRPVPEFAFVVGGLWLIWVYLRLSDDARTSRGLTRFGFWFGGVSGVMLLIKESTVVVIAAALLGLIWKQRKAWRGALVTCSYIAVIVGVVLSPWIVRNWVVQDRFIPLRTGYGYNLWIGNNPAATGSARTESGDFVPTSLPPDYAEYLRQFRPVDEQECDDFYAQEAFKFIAAYPGRFVELCAARLWYMLTWVPLHPLARNWIYRGSYILLCAVALPAIYLLAKRRRLDPIFPLLMILTLAMYVPVMVQPRYRIMVVSCLLILASALLSGFVSWKSPKPSD